MPLKTCRVVEYGDLRKRVVVIYDISVEKQGL